MESLEPDKKVGNLTIYDAVYTSQMLSTLMSKMAIRRVDVDGSTLVAGKDISPLSICTCTPEEYNSYFKGDESLSDVVFFVSSDFLDANGGRVVNVALPAADDDGASKQYVDEVASSLTGGTSFYFADSVRSDQANGVCWWTYSFNEDFPEAPSTIVMAELDIMSHANPGSTSSAYVEICTYDSETSSIAETIARSTNTNLVASESGRILRYYFDGVALDRDTVYAIKFCSEDGSLVGMPVSLVSSSIYKSHMASSATISYYGYVVAIGMSGKAQKYASSVTLVDQADGSTLFELKVVDGEIVVQRVEVADGSSSFALRRSLHVVLDSTSSPEEDTTIAIEDIVEPNNDDIEIEA